MNEAGSVWSRFGRCMAGGMALAMATLGATAVEAVELYVLNTSRQQDPTLRRVDLATGATEPVAEDQTLEVGSWSGLTSVPGLDNHVYAIHNPPTPLGDSQQSHLVKIRTTDGAVTNFPFFDTEALGVGAVFGTGIAVSPLNPNVATVSGFELFGPKFLFEVDLSSGAVLGPSVEIASGERLESLTYSLDGHTLYAADDDGRINTVNTETGELDLLLDPDLTDFLTGMAFHPDDGAFYLIDGFNRDRLLMTPSLGTADFTTLGHMGISGPEGLAFVSIPEPVTCGGLLAGLLVWLAGPRAVLRRAVV